MHRVFRRGWEAPSENPVQTRGAEEIRGIRVAFSLDTFFWRRKRKYLAVAMATLYTLFSSRNEGLRNIRN
jgi:hypothetical protein